MVVWRAGPLFLQRTRAIFANRGERDAHKGNELCQTSARHGQRERGQRESGQEQPAGLCTESIKILAKTSFLSTKYSVYGQSRVFR